MSARVDDWARDLTPSDELRRWFDRVPERFGDRVRFGDFVLAALPADAAGGASGLFTAAQQLGGAIGVAVIGTVFFGFLGIHSFTAALTHSTPYAAAAFLASGALSLVLPRTAVDDETLLEVEA